MCSEHALSLIENLNSKKTAIMCSSMVEHFARLARGPWFESRHNLVNIFSAILPELGVIMDMYKVKVVVI